MQISLYYEKLGDEHVVKGQFVKPPHVAKEDGFIGLRRDNKVTWVPWDRVIRWEARE